ncbi:21514_t:CDS:2 [Gigaspora margarita]|uniref:21514_t:CDS:1 n=1 Tax=Gigaspora margarita TaxID=4874 RepID=A0ABN7V3J5_GIGMA|nr:21514_t:CDS:2 [Gigaspora margarita]
MATVHEARLRYGNWIIQYDLGATALTASFGSSSGHYRQVYAINAVIQIRALPWAGGTSPNGAPHIRSIRLSIQVMQYMDLTNFVRGGRLPNIPRF